MFKNTASQKITVNAINSTTGNPVTGDAANITAYRALDGGSILATNDANPTELDATNMPGAYQFDLTQAETNCDLFDLVAVSATANVVLQPVSAYTVTPMRGTDNAALAATALTDVTWTDAKAAFIDAAITSRSDFDESTDQVIVATNNDKTGYDLNADQSGVTIGTTTDVTNGVVVTTNNDKTGYDLNADQSGVTVGTTNDVTNGVLLDATATSPQLVDDTWDEVLTGATHNIPTSAGKRIRDITDVVTHTGTSPNTGGTANTSIRIELDSAASAISRTYDPGVITIVVGTGAGQSRQIFEYDGPNRLAYVGRDWVTIPDNTSEFIITANSGDTHINEGLAQGGGVNTITLNALASSDNDAYVGQVAFLVAGVGADQAQRIDSYNGTTKVATVERNWTTQPTSGTIYAIMPNDLCSNSLIESMDTKIDIIDTNIDTILADYSTFDPEADVLENSKSYADMLRIMKAATAGKTTTNGTRFRDDADSKNRISATLDANNNRTAMTLDGS